jgi:predicted transposase YbfD/YdcC
MAKGIRIGLDEVVCHFAELEDPRSEVNRRHPLVSVVVIAIMAVLAGASGPTGIAKWARLKGDLLKRLLPLPNGVPRKDVFRRVLATLNPQGFQACFANWLQSMRDKAAEDTEIEKPVIAVDGKTLRRSHDKRKGLGALHSVSAWASDFGISLGQVATDAKSNEITAIPELLKLIDIKGAIITIDAMGTQTAIAGQIIDRGGDFVLALKGNHEKLHDAVIELVNKKLETNFSDCGARQYMTEETGHGREETRHYIQMPAPKTLPGFNGWKGLLTIGVAILHCIRDGKQTTDIRYYISSLPMGVKQFARAVRAHWGIENTCHWSLDVTYREDESRIRNEALRENFAWLNRFTLSLLKQHPDKDSLVMKRRSCGWNDEFLVETLTGITT